MNKREMDHATEVMLDVMLRILEPYADDDIIEPDPLLIALADELGIEYTHEHIPACTAGEVRARWRDAKAALAAECL